MALGPIVSHGVRENLSVCVEAAFGDRLLHGLRRFELGARVFVPETESAIRADGRQSPVHRMECNIVHSVNVLRAVVGRHTMTLEGEIVLRIRRVHLVNEMRRTQSFIKRAKYAKNLEH